MLTPGLSEHPQAPALLILDLRSRKASYNGNSAYLSDLRRRLLAYIAELPPGTVAPESEIQHKVWGDEAIVHSETCRVGVDSLLRIIRDTGCPKVLQREYRVGWKRTDVPISIINQPHVQEASATTMTSPVIVEPKLSPTDKLLNDLRKLRNVQPTMMINMVHRWQEARKRARVGSWSTKHKLKFLRVLSRVKELELDHDLLGGHDIFCVFMRCDERFAWAFQELIKEARVSQASSGTSPYTAYNDHVVMSYDSWLHLAYEVVLPISINELNTEEIHAASMHIDLEEENEYDDKSYSSTLVELYEIANSWHPAIDPAIPFGKVVIRSR